MHRIFKPNEVRMMILGFHWDCESRKLALGTPADINWGPLERGEVGLNCFYIGLNFSNLFPHPYIYIFFFFCFELVPLSSPSFFVAQPCSQMGSVGWGLSSFLLDSRLSGYPLKSCVIRDTGWTLTGLKRQNSR